MYAAFEAVFEGAFAPTSSVYLALYPHSFVAFIEELLNYHPCFLNGGGWLTSRNTDSMPCHQFFGLIFV